MSELPKVARCTLLLACLLSISACSIGSGALYTDVVEPLDLNMNNTPIGEKKGQSGLTRVTEPFTGAQLSVEVWSNAIADAAKRAGLTKVHYADLRRQEVLFGIWQQRTVFVYGE